MEASARCHTTRESKVLWTYSSESFEVIGSRGSMGTNQSKPHDVRLLNTHLRALPIATNTCDSSSAHAAGLVATSGSEAEALLREVATWGKTTTVILHGGCVFEFKGTFPAGNLGMGYYNLDGATSMGKSFLAAAIIPRPVWILMCVGWFF